MSDNSLADLIAPEPTATRVCKRCKLAREIIYFGKAPGYEYRYKLQCYDCINLFFLYGITYADYLRMLNEQNGVCKICKKPETSIWKNGKDGKPRFKRLAVDHCAETMKIRGLLCNKCNTGIGNFMHDRELLIVAIQYLEDAA